MSLAARKSVWQLEIAFLGSAGIHSDTRSIYGRKVSHCSESNKSSHIPRIQTADSTVSVIYAIFTHFHAGAILWPACLLRRMHRIAEKRATLFPLIAVWLLWNSFVCVRSVRKSQWHRFVQQNDCSYEQDLVVFCNVKRTVLVDHIFAHWMVQHFPVAAIHPSQASN